MSTQLVEMNGVQYEFPSDMSKDEIANVLQQKYYQLTNQSPDNGEAVYDKYAASPDTSVMDKGFNLYREGQNKIDEILSNPAYKRLDNAYDVYGVPNLSTQSAAILAGAKRGIGSVAEGTGNLIGQVANLIPNEIPDTLRSTTGVGELLPYLATKGIFNPPNTQSIQQSIADSRNQALDEYNTNPNVQEHPIPSSVGEALPYLLTTGAIPTTIPKAMATNAALFGVTGYAPTPEDRFKNAAVSGALTGGVMGLSNAMRGLANVVNDVKTSTKIGEANAAVKIAARGVNALEKTFDDYLMKGLRPNSPDQVFARNESRLFDSPNATFDDYLMKIEDPANEFVSSGKKPEMFRSYVTPEQAALLKDAGDPIPFTNVYKMPSKAEIANSVLFDTLVSGGASLATGFPTPIILRTADVIGRYPSVMSERIAQRQAGSIPHPIIDKMSPILMQYMNSDKTKE